MITVDAPPARRDGYQITDEDGALLMVAFGMGHRGPGNLGIPASTAIAACTCNEPTAYPAPSLQSSTETDETINTRRTVGINTRRPCTICNRKEDDR